MKKIIVFLVAVLFIILSLISCSKKGSPTAPSGDVYTAPTGTCTVTATITVTVTNAPLPVCTVTPHADIVNETEPNETTPMELGTIGAASGKSVLAQISDNGDMYDDYHFAAGVTGMYSIVADCFTFGSGGVVLQMLIADESLNITNAAAVDNTMTIKKALEFGKNYAIRVQKSSGTGPYKLHITGPQSAFTPSITPSITPTYNGSFSALCTASPQSTAAAETEPNNSSGDPITAGSVSASNDLVYTGTISDVDNGDCYKFTAVDSGIYEIILDCYSDVFPGGNILGMEVIVNGNNPVGEAGEDAPVQFVEAALFQGGEYTIYVFRNGGTFIPYRLSVKSKGAAFTKTITHTSTVTLTKTFTLTPSSTAESSYTVTATATFTEFLTETITATITVTPTATITVTSTATPDLSDSYEPDGEYTSASELVNGVTQNHSIFPENDSDWYVFTVPFAAAGVNIETFAGEQYGDTKMFLYNSSGVTVTHTAYNDDKDVSASDYYSKIYAVLAGGTYYAKVTGKQAGTTIESYDVRVDMSEIPVIPLQDALDNTGITFTAGGDGLWTGKTDVLSHDGTDMASTNTLDDRRAAYIEAVVTGTGTLSFWWRVSSEPDYDEFKWIADGVEQESISGDTAWAQVSVFIDGTSTIRWVYEKDFSLSGNDDKAYLDQVIFTPQ